MILFIKNTRKNSGACLVGWFLDVTILAVPLILIANPDFRTASRTS
jgi:hypothetical protein